MIIRRQKYTKIEFKGYLGLDKTDSRTLSVARHLLAATTVGDYALFGGGYSNGRSSTVDAYSTSLTRTTPTSLSVSRDDLAATTVGNYALFGGGQASSASYSTVDAYQYINTVKVYPNSIYKLGSMSEEQVSTTLQEIHVDPPITGYIKIKNTTIN